jgi:hypothetical protein
MDLFNLFGFIGETPKKHNLRQTIRIIEIELILLMFINFYFFRSFTNKYSNITILNYNV